MKRTILAIVLWCCSLLPSIAKADDGVDAWREMQRSTLKGAKAVYVSTVIIGPVKDPAGMDDRQMTDFVSLELRKNGIPLSAQPPDVKSLGEVLPMTIALTVSNEADVPGGGKLTAWHMRFLVHQVVSIPRLSDKRVVVVTWEAGPFIGNILRGFSPSKDQLRDALRTMAETFANDYLTANGR